jgi:predicted acylesterase/phospholipase RssA
MGQPFVAAQRVKCSVSRGDGLRGSSRVATADERPSAVPLTGRNERQLEDGCSEKVKVRRNDHPASGPGQIVLVFQGGGALGAYQAGVYQALEAGIEPDWIIGTNAVK